MYTFAINKTDYDPFIDYLKGVCIIFVVLTHCISPQLHRMTLFCLWGDMAVPMFLLIQTFHAYKKGLSGIHLHIGKLWRRIIFPFLIAQIIAVLILISWNSGDFSSISHFGNLGPGAYYPYIYLQFSFLLWMFAPLFHHLRNPYLLCFIFIALSQFLEIFCISMSVNEAIYRLLFFRYTFLIFLGYLMATGSLHLNRKTFLLSIVSMLFILVCDGVIPVGGWGNFGSIFYMSSFRDFHWISYFFVAYILLNLIYYIYQKMEKDNLISRFFIQCGKYSYEIFLFQMIVFLISPIDIIAGKLPIKTLYLEPFVLVLNILCCTMPVIMAKNMNFGRKHKIIQ